MQSRLIKSVVLLFLLVLLNACTKQQLVDNTMGAIDGTAQFVGIKDRPNTMQVPSYYSSQQIKKEYQLGRAYQIEHLDCDDGSKNCITQE